MLIGHNKQKKYFQNVIKNNALSHAYLFTGLEMIGKKTFALELFSLLNGYDFKGHPDFILLNPNYIEEESKIYIENIRKLKTFFRLKLHTGPYRLALIDDAHALTSEAANSLLKILEEPPSFSVIILISSMPGIMPSTITSRCEEVKFNQAIEEDIDIYLTDKKIKKDDREFLIKLSGGRIGLINHLIENNSIAEAHKAVEDLRKLLVGGVFEKMDYAKKIHEKGDYKPKIDYWLNWVSAHVRTSPKNEKIVKDLLVLHQLVSQPQYNHRLALENFLLNL